MRSLEETTFLQEVESLNKLITEESTKENPVVSVVIEAKKDPKKQFDVCKGMQSNYILLLEKNKALEEISCITKLQRIYSEVNLKAGKFLQTHSKQTSFETSASEKAHSILKLERMKLPSFDGDICDYVDDNLDEMWKHLYEKYGNASKLFDVVMFDIKHLKVIKKGDNKRFIELVDTVDRGYRDLERLSIQYEISNSTTVSMI